jgi:hypothetical protein
LSRTATDNEYKGKLLELPAFSALGLLKRDGTIRNYLPNFKKKYGGDFDAIVQLNDGSFLDLECMNFDTKYTYNEKSERIMDLPERLKQARGIFRKVRKQVLFITACLTANRDWLSKHCIRPIVVGEQITESMTGKKQADFVAFLVRKLIEIIERTKEKTVKLSLLNCLFWLMKSRFVKIIAPFTTVTLASDDIKWDICNLSSE